MSAAIHDRIAINAISFLGGDLTEADAIWRDLGARRISLTSPQLFDDGIDAVGALVTAGGYRVDTVSHIFCPGDLPQASADWAEPRDRLSRLIDMAATVGARTIYMLTGGRGPLDWENAAALFAEIIAPCIPKARDAGISLAIENTLPLYVDHHLATNLRDALTVVETAGIGLCIDIYAGWTEAGLAATIARAGPRIVLVQVSDYVFGDRALPSRAVPGDGVIPLSRILGYILATGYQGAFDIEILGPRIAREGPRAALRRAADSLGAMLRALDA